MDKEITNARIKSARLCYDHGFFTSELVLEFESYIQGFGGYALYKDGVDVAGLWITRVMDIAGVEDWSKLPGCIVRARSESGWNGKIVAIGNALKDDWFEPGVELPKAAGKEQNNE